MSSKSNPVIGVDNVVIAKLLTDAVGNTAPTYDTVKQIEGAVQISVANNGSTAVDYADNGAFFVASNRGNVAVTAEFTNLDDVTMAEMLGQKVSKGVVLESPMDSAPDFALGFRTWIGGTDANGNKIYQYTWLLKGKFSVPDTGATTKKENIEFQHKTLNANFVRTLADTTGNGNGMLSIHCRTDDTNVPADVLSGWFTAPVTSLPAETTAGSGDGDNG